MGLYTRLLKERAEEERRRESTLGMFYNLKSPVLDRRLTNPLETRPGYAADLAMLHRYTRTGPTNVGTGMRYAALRQRYVKEHAELVNEARGQGELF
jgi:hypothetical protein